MNLLERNEFIKASPAIQIQSNITHLQRRVWNVLLANAYDELPNKEIHRVSIAELAEKLGFDSRDTAHLKEALEALVDHKVKWNILGKDKKEVWGVAALLASAEIENGICTYGFAPHLRYKLYNPRIYTKLNLRLQNRFMSRYALILWEVCFDYFDTVRDYGETPFIPIDTFRNLMGLEKNEYPVFKVLNRDVIKPSIKEINELTNFFVEVEQKRQGRPIAFLKFRISRLKQVDGSEQEPLYPDVEDLPPIAIALLQVGVARREVLKIINEEWDMVDADADLNREDYRDFETYVEEKIIVARQATGVKNMGGFIVQAIRKNYQDAVAQAAFKERKGHEKKAMLAALESEMKEKRSALLRQAIRANPELLEKAAEKIQSYLALERLENANSLQEAYRDGGMVTAEINGILAEEFCQELLAPVYAVYETEKARILDEQ